MQSLAKNDGSQIKIIDAQVNLSYSFGMNMKWKIVRETNFFSNLRQHDVNMMWIGWVVKIGSNELCNKI